MRFDAKEFGGRIRDLRKKKGITQEQLSIMLIVSTKIPPIFLVQNFSNNLESLLWRYKDR